MSDEIKWSIVAADIAEDTACSEYQNMLAHLLINEVAFLNAHTAPWFDAPFRNAECGISINVLCSDTFGYACADCERLDHDQIPVLYRLWRNDPIHGATAWCVARRKERPIKPVADRLSARGYDLESLLRGEVPV